MFGTRLLSSIVLVILAVITLVPGKAVLGVMTAVLSLVGYRELMHACKVEKEGKPGLLEYVGYAGIILYYAVMICTRDFLYGMGVVVLLFLASMFVYVFGFPRYRAQQVMTSFFCAFYAGVLFAFIYLTRELTFGAYLVWLIFISAWVCDTSAYISGMAFGRRKLAPVLSPKKSVEGAIGGVIGAALVGALFAHFLMEPALQESNLVAPVAVICGVGAVIAQVGDLAASAIKRNHELKDYGKLIPGHGGVMDRFDSVLFTAPVIYFLSVILLRVGH